MRAITCLVLLALTCGGAYAHAEEPEQPWRWYLVAFNSPSLESDVLVRSGSAHVALDGLKIHVDFAEKILPELKATYLGSLAKDGEVKGTLDGLFFHGPESWNGAYSRATMGECRFEEIVLRSGVPDGSMLVLSRVQGICQ